jgi:hypothetical protein
MEPLNDDELREAASTWKAPGAPAHLQARIFDARRPWWQWLVTGAIRVPVPVCAAVLLFLVWLASGSGSSELAPRGSTDGQTEVTLADFEPAAEVRVRVVGDLR